VVEEPVLDSEHRSGRVYLPATLAQPTEVIVEFTVEIFERL